VDFVSTDVAGLPSGTSVNYVGRTTIVVSMALLADQLFVTRYPLAEVFVHNIESLQLIRSFTVPGLSTGPSAAGMVADAINNLLYIGDISNKQMQRRSTDVESTWLSSGSVLDPCRQHSRGATKSEYDHRVHSKWIARPKYNRQQRPISRCGSEERYMGSQSMWTSARDCHDINKRHCDQELRINRWFRTFTNELSNWYSQ